MRRRPFVAVQVVALLVVGEAAWAAPPTKPDLSDIVLTRSDAGAIALTSLVRERQLTAIVFFSETCPCFSAHRARLATLAREMEPRGVRFLIVDSERRQLRAPHPPFVPQTDLPILRDEDGRLARRLNAQFATETFVFDATGALRYRGGLDDDRRDLSAKPRAYLRDALLALLAGSAPAYRDAKALGCALRLM